LIVDLKISVRNGTKWKVNSFENEMTVGAVLLGITEGKTVNVNKAPSSDFADVFFGS
jgi:hypothetical protein